MLRVIRGGREFNGKKSFLAGTVANEEMEYIYMLKDAVCRAEQQYREACGEIIDRQSRGDSFAQDLLPRLQIIQSREPRRARKAGNGYGG